MVVHKLSNKDRAQALKDAASGMTQSEHADKWGISKQSSAYYFKRAGVHIGERNIIDEEPMAKKTVEQAAPKEIISQVEEQTVIEEIKEETTWNCGYCGHAHKQKEPKFCAECGKRLLWA